ncbi:hypothetical protein SCLCIDRAFT_1214981 [Scleroderma citrinum Foug A]|uniref:Uncharacterized protein n=1 Tax=Scleroderma citrinum Foug A TaxID=1036808 RepID=A0A0C3ABX1_9AGAM|nr:hypothetical protein SCLCIDRAFT_1214981 [Scleroderma citrinum Foug A]
MCYAVPASNPDLVYLLFSFISTTLASISLVAFAIDAGIVGALQKIIHDDTDGPVTLTWGND